MLTKYNSSYSKGNVSFLLKAVSMFNEEGPYFHILSGCDLSL